MWYQFKIDTFCNVLVLEVQQYGMNFLLKVKSVILALAYLKTRSMEKF